MRIPWLVVMTTLCASLLMATDGAGQDGDAPESQSLVLLVGSKPKQIRDKSLRQQLPGLEKKVQWISATCETTLLDAYYKDRVKPDRLNVWLRRLTNREWTHVLIDPPAADLDTWLPELAFEGLRLSVQRILERSPAAQIWVMGPSSRKQTQANNLIRKDLRRIAAGLSIGYFSMSGNDYEFDRSPKVDGEYVGYVTPLNLSGKVTGLAFGTSTMTRSIRKKLPGVFERDPRRDLDLHAVGGSMTEGMDDDQVRAGLKEAKVDFCWAQDKGEDFAKTLRRFRKELKQDAPFLYFLRYANASSIDNVHDIGPMMEFEGTVAHQLGSKAIPLRAAWGRVWERYPKVGLMERDLKHASDAGMRLITALTYAIVTGEDPSKIMTGAPGEIAAEVVYELGHLRLSPAGFAARPLIWHKDFQLALSRAQSLDKPLLLIASDGKRNAKATEEALADEASLSRLRRFELLRYDLPSAAPVLKELGIKSGVTLVVLDPGLAEPLAKPIARLGGKRDTAALSKFLDQALREL